MIAIKKFLARLWKLLIEAVAKLLDLATSLLILILKSRRAGALFEPLNN